MGQSSSSQVWIFERKQNNNNKNDKLSPYLLPELNTTFYLNMFLFCFLLFNALLQAKLCQIILNPAPFELQSNQDK